MKVRWIRSPPVSIWFQLVLGSISFVHIRNFFIAIDVLLRKKPFQCEQPCVLVARGGTRTPDDVVNLDQLLIIEATICHLLGPQNLRTVQDPVCGEIFVLCRTGQEVDILYRYNVSMDSDAVIFTMVHYLWLLNHVNQLSTLATAYPSDIKS
jgi:hypothetical protein